MRFFYTTLRDAINSFFGPHFELHTEPSTCLAVPHTENYKRAVTHTEGEMLAKFILHSDFPLTHICSAVTSYPQVLT